MAKEKKIHEVVREIGFDPIEGRAIIVRYAPENLSGKIADFFSVNNYYVLQICNEEILLIPIPMKSGLLGSEFKPQKEGVLVMKKDQIASVDLEEAGLNYLLTILYDNQKLQLKVQQKELSSLRSSGIVGTERDFFGTKVSNWHQENFSDTIADLTVIAENK